MDAASSCLLCADAVFGSSRRRNASAAILGSIVIAACMVATVSLFGRSSNEVELESEGPAAIQALVRENGMKKRQAPVCSMCMRTATYMGSKSHAHINEIHALHVVHQCK
jgi:hypothetical protein